MNEILIEESVVVWGHIMKRLGLHIIAGVFGLWLVTGIPGVNFEGHLSSLALAGFVLGIINFVIKPVLDVLTFPLKIITLGLFSLFLNMAIIWTVDVLILGRIFSLFPLFLATIVIGILNLILIRKN